MSHRATCAEHVEVIRDVFQEGVKNVLDCARTDIK